jgi:hypothetical protein
MPKLYKTREAVIIMQKMRGLEVSKVQSLSTRQAREAMSARNLTHEEQDRVLNTSLPAMMDDLRGFFLYSLFERGTFHADMHRGNEIVDTQSRAAMIDFGLVGRLSVEQRSIAKDLVRAIVLTDIDAMVSAYESFLGISAKPALRSALIAAVRKANGVDGLFKDVLDVFIRHAPVSDQRETLVRFMKGFAQALWMFPVTPRVFDELAAAAGMEKSDAARAMRKMAVFEVKKRIPVVGWVATSLYGLTHKTAQSSSAVNTKDLGGVDFSGGDYRIDGVMTIHFDEVDPAQLKELFADFEGFPFTMRWKNK